MSDALPATDAAIARVLAGDVNAFRDVVNACEGQVRAVVAAIHPAQDEIDDVVQEVFIVAFKKLAAYRLGTDFSFWLKAIARYVALNSRRQWYRRTSHTVALAPLEQLLESRVVELGDQLDPDVLAQLRTCLADLADVSRAVVEMRYFQQRNSEQIGRAFQRSAMWARHLLRKTRQELGDCLQRHGGIHA